MILFAPDAGPILRVGAAGGTVSIQSLFLAGYLPGLLIGVALIVLGMALVALPFAFRLGRQGALYGIGLSLILGIVLLLFLALFNAMGEAAILPPSIAVWSPGVIFSIFALYLFLGVRT